MKPITTLTAAGLAAVLLAAPGNAGGLNEPLVESEPVMEPAIVIEESSSSGGFVVPLMLLAVIAAVAAD